MAIYLHYFAFECCFNFCKSEVMTSLPHNLVWDSQPRFGLTQSEFLAHRSQRLIGELIVYPCSGVRPSYVYVVVHNFKHLLLRNLWADQSQILCAAFLDRGTIFCSRHLVHMTKMAATPIYGKNPSKIFFSRTGRPIFTKLGM